MTSPKDKNGINGDRSIVSLRQYIESLIFESDKRNDAQFMAAKEAVAAALAAAKEAVAAALVAQDKLTSAAFAAAKEALTEAQVQLTAYKMQSNEWRSTLTDLIATLMLRPEVLATFASTNKVIEDLKINFTDKIQAVESRVVTLESAGKYASGQIDASRLDYDRSRWNLRDALSLLAAMISIAAFLYIVIHK